MSEGWRGTVLVMVLAAPLLTGIFACYATRATSLDEIQSPEFVPKGRIILTYAEGRIVLDSGWGLDYPWVSGEVAKQSGDVPAEVTTDSLHRLNLEEAERVEFRVLQRGRT